MKALAALFRGGKAPTDFERASDEERDLAPFKSFADSVFGSVALMQRGKTREYVLVRESLFDSLGDAREALQATRAAAELKHRYLLPMLDYAHSARRSLCVRQYSVRQIYEFPRNDLRREVDARSKDGPAFSVEEMVHLLYQLIEVNAYLQLRGVAHGALSPAACGLTLGSPVELRLKLPPTGARAAGAALRDYLAQRPVYLSPAAFACAIRNREFAGDACAEDVFAAGLVVLEAGTLKPPAQLYRADGELDEEALRRLLYEFRARYIADSTLLVSVVENMLQRDEGRPTFRDIRDNMPSYEEVCAYLRDVAPAARAPPSNRL